MSGRLEKPISAQERTAAVLAVGSLPADHLRLREVFPQGSWKVLNPGGFDLPMTPIEPEEVLRVSLAAWSRWECDFVASTVKRADATDGVVLSAGNVVAPHGYTADGQGNRLSGLPGPARSRWPALRSKRKVAER